MLDIAGGTGDLARAFARHAGSSGRVVLTMTLLQALATGGGLAQRGTDKGIKVHRKGADGKVQIIEPGMTDTPREGEVVFVRESLF